MLFIFKLKCFLLHVKQIRISTPYLDKFKSTIELTEDVGHWYSIILQMNATFCLFFPLVRVSTPIACREGTLLQMELLRCELWLRASPWAVERSWGACGSCRKRRGCCSLLLAFWGLHGLCCTAGDTAAWSASRESFSGNPWRLRVLLCQKVGLNLGQYIE